MSESMGYMKLNEAFQYVDDVFLDIVEQERRKKKRKPLWKIAGTVAACICVLLLPIGVIAARWFGLWDLIIPKDDSEIIYFTLFDYAGSPEVNALREWEQFLAGYDTDRAILSEAMQNGFAPEGREDWLLYGVYSYEMGEKLDQIAKRYGLALHTNMDTITFEELQNRVGGSFITDADIEVCQVYEDGAFYVKGNIELDGYGKSAFVLHCVVKGALDATIPTRWDDNYDHWQYETACGEYTDLTLGAYRADILTGSNDCIFMAVVYDGRDSGVTEEILQGLADKIDFGVLKNMQLPEIDRDKPISDKTCISLSGYMDSPEAQALAEWEDFLAHYDTDHKIADEIGNGVFIAEGREDWSQYSVYSYEMGEKLDEIVEKYGLKLHTDVNVIDQDELMYRVGGCFMDKEYLTWAYMYEDGYFHVEGDVDLTGCGTTGFQLMRSVKGTFNTVVLHVRQVEDYTDWQYYTACGEPVLLALGPYHSLIIADFEKCFVTVNVLLGSEDGMTKEDLQEMADKIDFRILKDVQVPDMRGDSVVPTDGPLLREIFHGEMGNLGSGTLITADFCDDKQDYRIYFFVNKNGEEQDPNFNGRELKLEDADYIFPDAREGNIPIGTFQGFVVFEQGDIGRDGTSDLLLIGLYGVGEDYCVDSRVYTESGEGYVLNTALTQELNEKYYYYNAMEFPFRKILNDFGL